LPSTLQHCSRQSTFSFITEEGSASRWTCRTGWDFEDDFDFQHCWRGSCSRWKRSFATNAELKKNLGTISFNEDNIIFIRRGVKWIVKFIIAALRVHANGSGNCLLKRII
jgi:hypothetical protein